MDTNAYASLKRGHAESISIVQRAPFIAMSSTVLGELLGGFAVGAKEAQNRQELEVFLASPRVRLHVVDRDTAEKYAVIFASLRASGTPIPTNDMWIAASAIQHGLSLFSFDAHFQRVQGLRVGSTVAELSTP